MRPSAQVVEAITEQRLLAIVRLDSAGSAVEACRILTRAGVRAVEISLAQPDAVAAIAAAADELAGAAIVGAGTVRTVAHAAAAVGAGAEWLVGPGFVQDVAEWARERDVLYLPGAMTPTEVELASRWSPLVKLFPAGRLGPAYLADLRAPFPDVALVPTGGVGLDDARAFLDAGAAAVALGRALVNARSVAHAGELEATARRVLETTRTSHDRARKAAS
jgi:2-dehydro-3-deoxyphosphogluconate aldolase/(4S)-4-hydroxy-2-oxoglutarate aldolase